MAMTSHVTTYRVLPGRYGDFLTNCAAVKELSLRTGADQVRVSQTLSGGNSGTVTIMFAFESGEKYGKFLDMWATNEEYQALWAKVTSNPSAELVDESVYADMGI